MQAGRKHRFNRLAQIVFAISTSFRTWILDKGKPGFSPETISGCGIRRRSQSEDCSYMNTLSF
jgi:hypothetical protein